MSGSTFLRMSRFTSASLVTDEPIETANFAPEAKNIAKDNLPPSSCVVGGRFLFDEKVSHSQFHKLQNLLPNPTWRVHNHCDANRPKNGQRPVRLFKNLRSPSVASSRASLLSVLNFRRSRCSVAQHV